MNELKDKDLREALSRREARRTKPEVPADFCDSIMQEIAPKKSSGIRWRWMAAAATIILLIGIGTTLLMNQGSGGTTGNGLLTETGKQEIQPRKAQPTKPDTLEIRTSKPSTIIAQNNNPSKKKKETKTIVEQETAPQTITHSATVTEPNLHYATYTVAQDTTYQDPARVDEFITKFANHYNVKQTELECPDPKERNVTGVAYVFPDNKEIDVFGRLLQVACWYDSKTPGYLLNFSHQQLFFTLKDMRKGQKYLWIAERVNGDRILLYCTHSPIEANVSSACYQKYREQLTQNKFSSSKF